MNALNNLKVGTKLGFLIMVGLALLIAVGATGYVYLQEASRDINVMYTQRLIPVQLLTEIQANARNVNGAVLELMLTTDAKRNQELKDLIADRVAKNNQNMAVVEKLNLDGKAKELLTKVKTAQQKKHTAGESQTVLAATQEQSASMEEIASSSQALAKLALDLQTAVNKFHV